MARKSWSFRDSRLARRFVLVIVLFSSLLTLSVTGVQLLLQYRLDMKNVQQSAEIIQDSWVPALTESVWDYNTDLIELQLNGMINLPFIMEVRLSLNDGQFFAVGHPAPKNNQVYNFKIQHVDNGKHKELGKLTLAVDVNQVHQDLIRYGLTLVISNVFKAAIVVLFMLFIFHFLLGQYLIQIVAYLRGDDGHPAGEPLTLNRRSHTKDELDDVVEAYNSMAERLEQENQQRLAESEQRSIMQQQLARMDRQVTMGEMATSLAHELNQPLASITGYADISRRLLTQEKLERLDETLDKISNEAMRASEIIRRTREFVRSRKTSQEFISVRDLLEETVAIIRHSAEQYDTHIQLDISEIHSDSICVDKIQIQQVLLNLLRNAVDALREQEEQREIVINAIAHDSENKVCIQVCDNGAGIDESVLENIFSPFVTTKDDGMGIGLAISRAIVEAHHGQLTAHNRATGGACFELSLAATSVANRIEPMTEDDKNE